MVWSWESIVAGLGQEVQSKCIARGGVIFASLGPAISYLKIRFRFESYHPDYLSK